MSRYLKLPVLLPVIGFLALLTAWIGWRLQTGNAGDAVFKSIPVLGAGGDYAKADALKGSAWLHTARWFGLVFFALTATKAFRVLMARQLAETRALFSPRDLVLIGDHPTFGPLATALKKHRRVLWIAPEGTATIKGINIVTRKDKAQLRGFRLARARLAVVGFASDDVQALETARELNKLRNELDIIILSESLPPIERSAAFEGVHHVRVVAPGQAIIRSVHREYPPFLSAESAHRRLHCLIVGCGQLGEHVLADFLLSSLHAEFDKPMVTIVDPRAVEIRASLILRCPELERSVDLNFILPHGQEDARAFPIDELRAAAAAAPFSAAYVCLANDRTSLGAAAALDRLAASEGWPITRIFVRQSQSAASASATMSSAFERIVPFGTVDQLAEGLGLLRIDPDPLARLVHQSYRRTAPPDAPANVDWDMLPEHWREANRRVLVHLPAKAASAGLTPTVSGGGADPDDLPRVPDLAQRPDMLEKLAALEHERWMAERRLNGWRYGPQRDETVRRHPDLVPYEQLPERSQTFDRDIVLSLMAG